LGDATGISGGAFLVFSGAKGLLGGANLLFGGTI
jgi:hypothetical protein